jgi:hypothetical protein
MAQRFISVSRVVAAMRQRTKQEQLCDGHLGRGLIRHLREGMLHSEALFA